MSRGRVPCVACQATATWRVTWLEPSLSPVIPGPLKRDDPACSFHLLHVVVIASEHNGGALIGVCAFDGSPTDG